MKEILGIGLAAKKYIQEQDVKWKKHSVSSTVTGNPIEGYIHNKQKSITDNDPETDDTVKTSTEHIKANSRDDKKAILQKIIKSKNGNST